MKKKEIQLIRRTDKILISGYFVAIPLYRVEIHACPAVQTVFFHRKVSLQNQLLELKELLKKTFAPK
jgi:hypothetical protein